MKKIISIFIFIALIVIALGIYINSNQTQKPTESIETYLSQHISELSPVKETMGGTFYITKVEAVSGAGIIEYEDGHNAYIADFTYITTDSGNISITAFNVR